MSISNKIRPWNSLRRIISMNRYFLTRKKTGQFVKFLTLSSFVCRFRLNADFPMSSINLSDDLLNNFEDSIKNLLAFLLQDPSTGSSTASASGANNENQVAGFEQHMRRIHEAANEIECNVLQLKSLVHRTLPEEQVLESITELRTSIERKDNLLRDFNQHLNDAIADFSVENTESLNGLLDKLSQGGMASSLVNPVDFVDNLSQSTTNTQSSKSNESNFFSCSNFLRIFFSDEHFVVTRFGSRFVTFVLLEEILF